jgi:hypothetical protein
VDYEKVNAFHAEWDVPKEGMEEIELGCEVFRKVGWGEVEMQVLGGDGEDGATVILERKGGGQPAVFASWLGAQVSWLRKDGVSEVEIKERLPKLAQSVMGNETLYRQVMSRSLANTMGGLGLVVEELSEEIDEGKLEDRDKAGGRVAQLVQRMVNEEELL